MSEASAVRRVAAFGPHAAVVFGSGLAALPHGARVEAELGYGELGWPVTAVPGHANLLRLVVVPWPEDAGEGAGRPPEDERELRLALACGRPHRYEGWSDEELERPVSDLVAAGAGRLLLTNSCGALAGGVSAGDMVVCHTVVDLQAPPPPGEARPLRLILSDDETAGRVAGAAGRAAAAGVGAALPASVRTGVYVAVAGPQFESPAEVAWLAGEGDVVGMSAAPEVRAAHRAGATCCLLGLVANRAAAVGSHQDVLAVGAALAGALAAAVPAAVLARWPEIAELPTRGVPWTS